MWGRRTQWRRWKQQPNRHDSRPCLGAACCDLPTASSHIGDDMRCPPNMLMYGGCICTLEVSWEVSSELCWEVSWEVSLEASSEVCWKVCWEVSSEVCWEVSSEVSLIIKVGGEVPWVFVTHEPQGDLAVVLGSACQGT